MEWQQRIDLVDVAGWEFLQGVAEPGSRVEAIDGCGGQQTLDSCRALAGTLRSCEEPVLLPKTNRPYGIFHRVVVDRQCAIRGIATQRSPALQAVIDRFRRSPTVG